jgi:taurine dioxygenase
VEQRAVTYASAPLAEHLQFGAHVTGLLPDMLDDPAVHSSLRELWIERGVVVFDAVPGGAASHLRLSEIFGECEVHPLRPKDAASAPELSDIRYLPEDGDIFEIDGEPRGGWLPWHSDLIYVDRINHGGILRPVHLPEHGGGDTGFIDQIAAYDSLPDALKARIDDHSVVYWLQLDVSTERFVHVPNLRMVRLRSSSARIMEQVDTFPRVVHPLVFAQPETGRKVLNLSPWFAQGIEGMETEAGDALLHRLVEHTLDPRGTYIHRWCATDMVLWDNWRMLHSATGVAPDDTRHLQRTTIKGDYALGRIELADGEISHEMRLNV